MKAMEDKKNAVLAGCESRCPKLETPTEIGGSVFLERSNGGTFFFQLADGEILFTVFESLDATSPRWNAAYSLLSLWVQSQSLDEIIKWGQDAATFGVTPEIYYELLTKIGNVSFQSPAPDENGLMPCAHCGESGYVRSIETEERCGFEVYCYCGASVKAATEGESKVLWNTCAPIQKQSFAELNEAVLKTARTIVEDMEMGREGPNVTVERILSLVRDYADLYASTQQSLSED